MIEQNVALLRALNHHDVEYLVVGGQAVSYYCPQRAVGDLDLLVNTTLVNAEKVRSALISVGMNDFEHTKLTKPKVQIPLKVLHDADIITPEDGFDFSAAFSRAVQAEINGVPISILSVEDLIIMKTTDRKKDLRDVSLLRLSISALQGRQP